MPRDNLLGLTRPRLAQHLAPVIDHPYRVGQLFDAIYRRGVRELDEVTELGKELRRRLAADYRVGLPEEAERHLSVDRTRKFLFRLEDGATIETVEIPIGKRRTLCLSSQAGCALACSFCVTGFWGAGRNLTAGEIVGQVLAVRGRLPRPAPGLNLVFMGMGEPLLNLDAVADALEIFSESVAWRRITLSTAGVLPGIEAMTRWKERPNLAISLHAPDDERRDQVMPVNRTYPLADLFDMLRGYPLERGRKITFEYILIRGFNDAVSDADALAGRISGLAAKVNLIPLNPDPVLGDAMRPPSEESVEAFRRRLAGHGVLVTVRQRRGDDVSAACGQLRAPGREPRGFRRSNLSL